MTPAPSSRSGRGKPIGEILLESEAISPEQLARAIAEQNSNYDLIGRILVRQGACGLGDILSALQAQYRVTAVEIARVPLDARAIEKVDKETCEKGRLIPFDFIGNTICVAMTNVLNRKAITNIEETTECKVKAFSASWLEIKKVITAYFDKGGEGVAMAAPIEDVAVAGEAPPVPPSSAPEAAPAPAAPTVAEVPAAPTVAEVPAPPAAPQEKEAPAEAAVVPFSGKKSTRRQKKKSTKRDTMRTLKTQLMKDKGGEKTAAPAKEDIAVPRTEEPAAPPPTEEVVAAVEEPPVVEVPPPPEAEPEASPVAEEVAPEPAPSPGGPPATVAYQPTPEWADYPKPPAEGLVPARAASKDTEPALVKKLRERGHRGAADHEILDTLPVAERFAPSLDDYKVTVSALAALEDVVAEPEAAPTVSAEAPVPPEEVVAVEPAPEAEPAPAAAPAQPAVKAPIKAPSVSVSGKVRPAIALSEEEIAALAPRENEDVEAGFRARFLSSRPAKAVAVD